MHSVKASGNWMWAAKLVGEGPKMCDAAEAVSDLLCDLGISMDGGKDSSSGESPAEAP
jgi:phosphoribosylformylglycinamidine synthase